MRLRNSKINWGIRSGREWLMLFFSLLLAFFMWIVHNLSTTTASYYNFRINVTSNLEGRSDTATSEGVVVLSGKSSGFYILQNFISDRIPELSVTLDRKYFRQADTGDLFYVKGADLAGEISSVLKDRISVDMIVSDTVFFRFPRQTSKRVPVVADAMISYRPQFMSFGEMVFTPDSITIYGEADLLASVDSVRTEHIKISQAAGDIQGVCSLVPVEGIRFSDREVLYRQSIGRYVEHSMTIQPEVINLPEDKEMILLPGELKMVFRQPFAVRQEVLPSDFVVVIDYNRYISSQSSLVRPEVSISPGFVYDIELDPVMVECILRKKI